MEPKDATRKEKGAEKQQKERRKCMHKSTVGPVGRQGVKNVSNPVVKQSYGPKNMVY